MTNLLHCSLLMRRKASGAKPAVDAAENPAAFHLISCMNIKVMTASMGIFNELPRCSRTRRLNHGWTLSPPLLRLKATASRTAAEVLDPGQGDHAASVPLGKSMISNVRMNIVRGCLLACVLV